MKYGELQGIYNDLVELKNFKPKDKKEMDFFWDVVRLRREIDSELEVLKEIIEPFNLDEKEMEYYNLVQANSDVKAVPDEVIKSTKEKVQAQSNANMKECEKVFKKFNEKDIPIGVNGGVLIALSNFIDL